MKIRPSKKAIKWIILLMILVLPLGFFFGPFVWAWYRKRQEIQKNAKSASKNYLKSLADKVKNSGSQNTES